MRRFFTALVVGDNHEEIIKKYSIDNKVEKYVKYKYTDAKKYQSAIKKALSAICDDRRKSGLSNGQIELVKGRLAAIEKMSPFEYYQMLTEGMYYDEDGNALSDENPNAKYRSCHLGEMFSIPFKMQDGTEAYTAIKGDVDWKQMHMAGMKVYERAWDLVVNDEEPENDEEKRIKKIMGEKKNYFSTFPSKDAYVTYSTAYWAYAIVDENGWKDSDTECNADMMKWIGSFYDKFIKELPDNTRLTIYECSVL